MSVFPSFFTKLRFIFETEPAAEFFSELLAFEGQTVIDEFKNADRSRDIHAYKKFGVATFATNAMAAYKNTSLVKDNTIAG